MRIFGSVTVFISIALAAGVLLSWTETAHGQETEVWSSTPGPDLAFARERHGAVTQADGSVLLMGGFGTQSEIPGEVFRPSTDSFETAFFPESFGEHAMILLDDGAVVIAGGRDSGGQALSQISVYVPVGSEAIQAMPDDVEQVVLRSNMAAPEGRFSPTATLLDDGDVLIAGGGSFTEDGGFRLTITPEIDDPVSGVARFIPNNRAARIEHTATKLTDGRVLLVGGSSWPGQSDARAELFVPASEVFIESGPVSLPRSRHTATRLQDGRVLIAGGLNGSDVTGTAEVYDPATNVFASTGSMASPRRDHTATLLPDGRVLIAGGRDANDAPLATGEIFDPTFGAFSTPFSLAEGRYSHTASLLHDGRVLIAGGIGAGATLSSVEILGVEAPQAPVEPESAGELSLLPQPGRSALAVWSGGSVEAMATAAVLGGCQLQSVGATPASGGIVLYVVGAPPLVNSTFLGAFPAGVLPQSAVSIRCAN